MTTRYKNICFYVAGSREAVKDVWMAAAELREGKKDYFRFLQTRGRKKEDIQSLKLVNRHNSVHPSNYLVYTPPVIQKTDNLYPYISRCPCYQTQSPCNFIPPEIPKAFRQPEAYVRKLPDVTPARIRSKIVFTYIKVKST